MKSLHLQELSWEAAGKVSVLITQDRENKAPTCNRRHFLSLSPQCSSFGKYVVGRKLSISDFDRFGYFSVGESIYLA